MTKEFVCSNAIQLLKFSILQWELLTLHMTGYQ